MALRLATAATSTRCLAALPLTPIRSTSSILTRTCRMPPNACIQQSNYVSPQHRALLVHFSSHDRRGMIHITPTMNQQSSTTPNRRRFMPSRLTLLTMAVSLISITALTSAQSSGDKPSSSSHHPRHHRHHHQHHHHQADEQSSATSSSETPPQPVAKFGPRLTIFSGGSGFNATAILLKSFTNQVTYIMPVSDNGGSTAEISRVLGGPALGDIRSRLMALASDHNAQERAVIQLLKHRLPNHDSDDSEARLEWTRIVEGTHPLWENMSPACKATIRSFLVHFQHEVLLNADKKFDFRNGSIGNFFFTGTRLFFRSMDAAIWWFSGVTSIPRASSVVPVLHTNSRVTIGAELLDGSTIIGQSEISHPNSPTTVASSTVVDKNNTPKLPSPIKKVMYVNDDGQSTRPDTNSTALHRLRRTTHVIYGQGSLYTSIVPCLILPGVGEAVTSVPGHKILVLNGSHDRETQGLTALDFVNAISNALNRYGELKHPARRYIDTVIVSRGCEIECDADQLRRLGIRVVYVEPTSELTPHMFDERKLVRSLMDLTSSPALSSS